MVKRSQFNRTDSIDVANVVIEWLSDSVDHFGLVFILLFYRSPRTS
jgi:hypothetical protein